MPLTETLQLALIALKAHKMRSALTLLGMVIGVAAVIIVVSVIQGFNHYVDENIAGVGLRNFAITRLSFDDWQNIDTYAAAQRRNKYLTLDDLAYLRANASAIGNIGARAWGINQQMAKGSTIVDNVPVDGVTPDLAEIEGTYFAEGRYFAPEENAKARRVVFLGPDVANNLFPGQSAVGQEVKIAGQPYHVIGVATARGAVFGVSQDTYASLPLRTYEAAFGPLVRERQLYFIASAKSDELFPDAVDEAVDLMRTRRHLKPDEKDSFGIQTPDLITSLRQRIFGPIYVAALAVPAISLIVGGIGIMNIMLVSVTERTQEIGLRRSVGARSRDILKQFLLEALTLALLGGALGILLGWLAGRMITIIFFPTYLSLSAIIIAVGVSVLVGLGSGFLPAWKAAGLAPVEALRAE